MSSSPAGKFQDHYLVLNVESKADSETIQKAYTTLAARFHPNNKETGDPEKFQAVTQAYEVLADPAARTAFDAVRSGPEKEAPSRFSGSGFFHALAGELLRRQCILCLLYDRRRQYPLRPILSLKQIETMMNASFEEVQFSVWYLRQKGQVTADDKNNLQISVAGMESLERELPNADDILALVKATQDPAEPAAPERQPAVVATTETSQAKPPATKPLVPPPAKHAAGAPTLSYPRKTIVIPPRAQPQQP
jgi:curved DNA-binding protein CbpA